MRTLSIIIARAGSVGLPSKHLLQLLGRPVIDYTFDHADLAACPEETVVSSDCPNVLRLAENRDFLTVERPAHLATSETTVQDVLLHTLEAIERTESWRPDAVVLLYGNVPVRPKGLIDNAVRTLTDWGCDSIRSFTPVGKWHPAWMAEIRDGHVIPTVRGSIHRRQDLSPLYLHDGGVVAVTRAALMNGKVTPEDPHAFFGTDRRAVITEPGSVIEIDHARDLYWAEAVLRDQASKQTAVNRRAS